MVGHLTPIGRSRRRRLLGQIPGQRQKSTKIGGAGAVVGPQNDWCTYRADPGPPVWNLKRYWRGTIKGIGVGSPEAVVWGPQRHWCRNHKGAGVGPLRCWCEALTWTPLWCLRHWCGAKPTPFTDGCVWGPWSGWCEMRMLNNPVGPLRDRQRALRGR